MIRQIHECTAIVGLALSVLFNSALIWLVLKRSPQEMRVYSRILLQSAVVDILLSFGMFLTQPIFFEYGDEAVLYLNSPLARNICSTPIQFLLIEMASFLFYFSVFGLCFQFVYRYLVLTRNVSISLGRYFLMLFVPLCAVLVSCFLAYLEAYPNPDWIKSKKIAELLSMDSDQQTIRVALSSSNSDRYALLSYLFVLNALCYGIITFCGYRMHKYIQQKVIDATDTIRQRRADLHRQLTRSLIILAMMPLVPFVTNLAFELYLLTSQTGSILASSTSSQMLTTVPIYLLPALNPLIYILIVKPYRRAIVSFGSVRPAKSTNAIRQLPSPTNGAMIVTIN